MPSEHSHLTFATSYLRYSLSFLSLDRALLLSQHSVRLTPFVHLQHFFEALWLHHVPESVECSCQFDAEDSLKHLSSSA